MTIEKDLIDSFIGGKDIPAYTDKYFSKTRKILEHFGDEQVTYAVFLRRPVLYACEIAILWLKQQAQELGFTVDVKENYKTGDWVGAGEPLFYYSGSFARLVELETLLLQKVGMTCVAAYNAYEMAKALPNVAFSAMEARHCTGADMMQLAAFAAFVGSEAAKRDFDAIGFIGTSNDATMKVFGKTEGLGTMPHALIGYAGSTLKAAQLYHETFPDEPLTVLNDYFGREVTDSIEVCKAFPDLAKSGRLAFRTDTHGGRFVEGLDTNKSYAVLARRAPRAIKDLRKEDELKYLIGTGVSAAAMWHLRENLNEAGFPNVRLVASSGFTVKKCQVFAIANAPVNNIGTGSYLPENWLDTYTTADIVSYGGQHRVKLGREFLLDKL